MNKRFTLRMSVQLLLKKEDQLLVYLRKNTGWADGMYALVAGHVDGNESAKQAMIREAQEEAGIIIEPQDLHVVHVMHRQSDCEYIDVFMQCDRWQGEVRNCEPHKCGELRFVSTTALPQNTLEYVKQAIKNINAQKSYDELGW
jgi:8-oxo-dGTP pyrophosphatase MutT (NUDIX family)